MGNSDKTSDAKKADAAKLGASKPGASKPGASKPDVTKKTGSGRKPAIVPPATDNTRNIPVRTSAHSGETTGSAVNTERPPSRQRPQQDTGRPSSSHPENTNRNTVNNERPPSRQRPQQDIGRPSTSHSQSSSTSLKSKASTQRSYGTTNSGGSSSSGGTEVDRYYVSNDTLRIHRHSHGGRDAEEVWIAIEPTSPDYLEMRRCVNVAMGILARSRNRAAMSTYSTQLVDAIEAENLPSTVGNEVDIYDGEDMNAIVGFWLDKMRTDFPDIYISRNTNEDYAITSRISWGTEWSKNVPQEAAYIEIHHEVSNDYGLFGLF